MTRLPLALLVLGTCNGPRAADDGDDPETDDASHPEGWFMGDCTDLTDNDGDGAVDCEDEGCSDVPTCRYQDGYYGGDSGFDGRDSGDRPGTGTYESAVIAHFAPPGCLGGRLWSYRVDLAGWSVSNVVNAFETGVADVPLRWNEENQLESIDVSERPMTEELGLDLEAGVELDAYEEGVNTPYLCGVHDDPVEASNTYVVRIYNLDANFSDCGFGVDPKAPDDAVETIRNGTAWDDAVSPEPSGDWEVEFNAGCPEWRFD